MERSELAGHEVILRRTTLADAPALAAILAEPGVARWWGTFDLERVTADLMGTDPEEYAFTIEHDGEIVGYIQAVEEDEPDFRSAGIDLFLRTDAQGRGLGPDAIRAVAGYLIDDRGHHRLTIDPAAGNARAIAAYAKLGFRPVGRMRQYQRMADGGWVDALLMDLLAAELVR
jgi:aminoglycoside 6'-N-acetyltransferase